MTAAVDDELWAAVGDPTRRRMLDLLLVEGTGTATSLSEHLPVTRQAVAKHLAVLATSGGAVDEAGPVEHRQVLGDGLAGDRQLLAQRRGRPGAVDQQEVEHPAPGRVAHSRPELVVDGGRHDATPTVRA